MNACQAMLAALIVQTSAVAAGAEGLCTTKEAVIFNCEFERAAASLCQSVKNGNLVYRSARDGRLAVEVSNEGGGKEQVFRFSFAPYAGGGEAHIRFKQSEYTYYLYDYTIRTDEGPTFSAGVAIYRRDKRISNLNCVNDASIRASAYESIDREGYRRIENR